MLHVNFNPFPALTTDRFILRKLHITDSAEVFIQRSDPTIRKFIKRAPAINLGEAQAWIEKMLNQEEKKRNN